MKKIITMFLSCAMAISAAISMHAMPVGAAELKTPSGIAYADIGNEIEKYVEERKGGLASMETTVFCGSETIYSGNFGYQDIENNIPATNQTVYEWGSATKLITWVSVMQLAERGQIDLNADIRTYLPDGFFKHLKYEEPITMNHVMSHTAGWQETVFEIETTDENKIKSLGEALRYSEPVQAFAPGEHTAYSNWGAALAGYIVECVTGQNFADYVHKNIFEPLGMEHTSIAPSFSDNMWVKEQREKLKSYCIMQGVNESFGTNKSYILLYPAGSACGTMEDFTTFAKSFVSDDCPLFEKDETRATMLKATTYYGDSDIAKNCHGLWTAEYAVQAMGHGGNTIACSSMLQFDPKTGLGIVVMTNEQGETAFNYGLPGLIFGNVEDSERIRNSTITDNGNISGIYVATRSFPKGFMNVYDVIGSGSFMPVTKGKDANQFNILNAMKMYRIADNQWIQTNGNGMNMFLYETVKDGVRTFEMETTDYCYSKTYVYKALLLIAAVLISVISAIILLVKLAAVIVRKVNKQDVPHKTGSHLSTVTEILCVVTGTVLGLFLMAESINKSFAFISCILAAVVGVVFALLALCHIAHMIKAKKASAKHISWTACSMVMTLFIFCLQFYNFCPC